jgi:hypothetical protein
MDCLIYIIVMPMGYHIHGWPIKGTIGRPIWQANDLNVSPLAIGMPAVPLVGLDWLAMY